jgi:plastocyanin
MQGLRFHPAAVVVHAGQQVKWTNADNVDHNVTAVSGATFKSQAFGHGQTYSFVANRPGTIHYVCTLHPGMNGTINVRK